MITMPEIRDKVRSREFDSVRFQGSKVVAYKDGVAKMFRLARYTGRYVTTNTRGIELLVQFETEEERNDFAESIGIAIR